MYVLENHVDFEIWDFIESTDLMVEFEGCSI